MPLNFGPAPSYHVMCLLLLLVAQPTNQDRCSEHVVCRGERPTLPTGCCPVEAGLVCRPDNGDACDTELGFQCRSQEDGNIISQGEGVCKGIFNLTVTFLEPTRLGLSWLDFAPEDYFYEYVLQYRAWTYNYDFGHWVTIECGTDPSYILRSLIPGTLYFVRVAIWEDALPWTFRNTTETIIVVTPPVSYCEDMGHEYAVGESFIHECEDNCTCTASGEFSCEPLCQAEGLPEVGEGCSLERGEGCCNFTVSCPVVGASCEVNGTVYPDNYVLEDECRICECIHGQLQCVYPHCESPSCPNAQPREVPGRCCPEWYCERTCSYENRTYNHLEFFTSTHCGLCQCDITEGVECSPDCPPVAMVLPNAACPDPHVRQDGCCPTLHCFDLTQDLFHFMRQIFSLSRGPGAWTVSFNVDPIDVANGVPLFCEYEITYAPALPSNLTWYRRSVQPVDVRISQDESSSSSSWPNPSQVLTTNSAIVVGNRAYVTMAGMNPNTTYYVRIRPLNEDRQDVAGGASGQNGGNGENMYIKGAAMVVVKTLPLNNATSCFHNGQEVPHDSPVESHCSQQCKCVLGQVKCVTACQNERVVIAASSSCPSPRLEKVEGECCPKWTCYPSDSGCRHGDLILESDHSINIGCSLCTCRNGNMSCASVCPPTGEPPRPDCKLTNSTGHCCLQWQCPLETKPAVGVEASVVIVFLGTCIQPIAAFQTNLSSQILDNVKNEITSQYSELLRLRESLRIQVVCPEIGNVKKRSTRSLYLREPNKISVGVYIRANFSSQTSEDETTSVLQTALTQLYDLLSSGVQITFNDGEVYMSSEVNKGPLNYVCDPGFAYVKDSCVLSEIKTSPLFYQALRLQGSQISDTVLVLQWDALDARASKHVTGIKVEYRLYSRVNWNLYAHILPNATSFTLTNLKPDQEYVIRLVAVTSWAGRNKWVVGETRIQLKSAANALSSNLTAIVDLQDPWINDTCALFVWDPPPDHVIPYIIDAHVVYKHIQSQMFTHKAKLPSTRQTHMAIDKLEPGTPYVAKLVVVMSTGHAMESQDKHFVTRKQETSNDKMLLLAIIIPGVLVVILALAAVVWLFRRRGKNGGGNTDFVNMGYGLETTTTSSETDAAVNPSAN